MSAKSSKPAKARSRSEIDKDIMYSKIMPTGLTDLYRAPDPETSEDGETPAPASAPPVPSEGILRRGGIQVHEKNSAAVINLMELLVTEKLDAAFDKFNCCKCNKCRKDAVAIALNNLHPKYVVIDPEQADALLTKEMYAEATAAIVKAILVVRTHPRH